jgi:hypothetical protein
LTGLKINEDIKGEKLNKIIESQMKYW